MAGESPGCWTFLPGDPCVVSYGPALAVSVEGLDLTLKSISLSAKDFEVQDYRLD